MTIVPSWFPSKCSNSASCGSDFLGDWKTPRRSKVFFLRELECKSSAIECLHAIVKGIMNGFCILIVLRQVRGLDHVFITIVFVLRRFKNFIRFLLVGISHIWNSSHLKFITFEIYHISNFSQLIFIKFEIYQIGNISLKLRNFLKVVGSSQALVICVDEIVAVPFQPLTTWALVGKLFKLDCGLLLNLSTHHYTINAMVTL